MLAALILPADLVDRINSLSTPSPQTPEVEVIVNEEDPVKARLVNDRINSLLTQANLVIARQIAAEGGKFLGLVLDGGQFSVLGQTIQILGLAQQRPASSKRSGRRCRRACATRSTR